MNRLNQLTKFPELLEAILSGTPIVAAHPQDEVEATAATAKSAGRFALVVEADDPRIGIFSACAVANLTNNFVAGRPTEDDRELLIEVAGLLEMFPETKPEIAKLAQALGEAVENISSVIAFLREDCPEQDDDEEDGD